MILKRRVFPPHTPLSQSLVMINRDPGGARGACQIPVQGVKMPRFQNLTASAVTEDMLIQTRYSLRCLLLTLPLTLLFAGSLAGSFALAQTETQSVEELVQEADFYLSRGSCELAQLRFQQALEREPTNEAAATGKGDALVCQGAFDLGIQEYQNVISSNPNSVRAYNQLARAYLDQYVSDSQRFPNRLVDALEAVTTAERLGSNPDVANTKAVILYQSGDYAGAQAAFQNAISGASEDTYSATDRAAMHINLGKTYRQLGQLQEAETAFKRAVTLDPASAQAHSELGDTYFRLENCEDAEFELTQATSLDPNNLSAAANLAIALFECGDVAGSVPRLQQAITLGGVNLPPLYTYLARAYLQQSRAADAVTEAQKGALLPPVTAEGFYWLGQAYEARGEAGDAAKAADAYGRALEIDPEYGPARDAQSSLR